MCPTGYEVVVTGGCEGIALPSGVREVREGDVLVVHFRQIGAPNESAGLVASGVSNEEVGADDEGQVSGQGPARGDGGGGRLSILEVDPVNATLVGSARRRRGRRSGGGFGCMTRTCIIVVWISQCVEAMQVGSLAHSDAASACCPAIEQERPKIGRRDRIPTPCRGGFRLPCVWGDSDLCTFCVDGPTLLEESCTKDDSCFLEARSLLEVLSEFYEEVAQQQAHPQDQNCAPHDGPTVLRLVELVGPPKPTCGGGEGDALQFCIDEGQCNLPCSIEKVQELRQSIKFDGLSDVPKGV